VQLLRVGPGGVTHPRSATSVGFSQLDHRGGAGFPASAATVSRPDRLVVRAATVAGASSGENNPKVSFGMRVAAPIGRMDRSHEAGAGRTVAQA
jgi:hypothetical protein